MLAVGHLLEIQIECHQTVDSKQKLSSLLLDFKSLNCDIILHRVDLKLVRLTQVLM